MSFRKRIGFPLAWICLLEVLAGCFTEVGNAEDERLVTAQFNIDYSATAQQLPKVATDTPVTDSVRISQFYLFVKEAVYHVSDSASGHLVEKYFWKDDSAVSAVDFTEMDTTAMLPTQKMNNENPEDLILEYQFPSHAQLNLDTFDFDTFKDRGYLKGTYGGSSPVNFIFALPSGKEVHISYSKAALQSWLKNNSYDCRFTFFATKWLLGTDLTQAATLKGKSGKGVVVLDTNSNADLYQTLLTSFYKSFNTAQVYVESGR